MNDAAPNRKPKDAGLWDREPDNWYVEPDWCAQRLFEVERFEGEIVDPCAGTGSILRGARALGIQARGSDLRERGFPPVMGGKDFFAEAGGWWPGYYPCPNIVSNPPYGRDPDGGRLEERFLLLALARTRRKVAAFLPSAWLTARQRFLDGLPLYRVYQVSPRPACPPGPFLAAGGKPGNGRQDFSWVVFLHGYDGEPVLRWLRRGGA